MNRLAVAVVAVLALAAGCGSTHHLSAGTTTTTNVTTTSPPSVATVPVGHLPTVPNCGGGAYKPMTLIIVCGIGTPMVTGITWTSWTVSAAGGQGLVHLTVHGQVLESPARLALGDVAGGDSGPQFTMLTVTWLATSPDGRAADRYRLAIG